MDAKVQFNLTLDCWEYRWVFIQPSLIMLICRAILNSTFHRGSIRSRWLRNRRSRLANVRGWRLYWLLRVMTSVVSQSFDAKRRLGVCAVTQRSLLMRWSEKQKLPQVATISESYTASWKNWSQIFWWCYQGCQPSAPHNGSPIYKIEMAGHRIMRIETASLNSGSIISAMSALKPLGWRSPCRKIHPSSCSFPVDVCSRCFWRKG